MKKLCLILGLMMLSLGLLAKEYTFNAKNNTWYPNKPNVSDVTELIINAPHFTEVNDQLDNIKVADMQNLTTITVNGGWLKAGCCENNYANIIYLNYVNYITADAFRNSSHISDVYVKGNPKCEHNAFCYNITVSQTNTSNINSLATLHYEKQYYNLFEQPKVEYIASEMVNRTNVDLASRLQNILSTIKDGNVFKNGYDGWNEFVNTGNDVIKAKTFRSYSDKVARIVPDENMVFYVDGIKDGYLNLVNIPKGNVIPANTGVLIYSQNAVYMQPTTTDKIITNNLLMPQTDNDSIRINCFDRDADGNIAFRNFILGKYSQTTIFDHGTNDYYAMWKVISGYYKYGYAYLHVSANVCPDPTKVSYLFPNYNEEWYKAIMKEMVFDNINPITNTPIDSSYYNLNGMKINQPSHGIYIFNHKKYYFK